MKKLLTALALTASVVAFGAPADAKQPKVDVCHDGDDGIELINVAAPAVDALLARGDSLPGDDIPANDEFPDGAVWGDDCVPVPNDPPLSLNVDSLTLDPVCASKVDALVSPPIVSTIIVRATLSGDGWTVWDSVSSGQPIFNGQPGILYGLPTVPGEQSVEVNLADNGQFVSTETITYTVPECTPLQRYEIPLRPVCEDLGGIYSFGVGSAFVGACNRATDFTTAEFSQWKSTCDREVPFTFGATQPIPTRMICIGP